MPRRLRLVPGLVFLLSCTDSNPVGPLDNVTPVPAGQTASTTLSAAGGTLSLESLDGASFELDVPAGALDSAVTVSITSVEATREQRFHLRFAPSGLAFQAPVRVTIALPEENALRDGAVVAYDGVPLPVEHLVDGRLRVELRGFASPPAATVLGAALARLGGGTASLTQPCGSLPVAGQFEVGGLTALDTAAAEVYGACMLAAIQDLAANGQYEAAVRAAAATSAYLQSVGAVSDAPILVQARSVACIAYVGALSEGEAATITAFGQAQDLVRRALFWAETATMIGAVCPQATTDRLEALLTALADKTEQYYASRAAEITGPGANYEAAVSEGAATKRVVAEVRSLSPTPAVDALLDEHVQGSMQDALLEALLRAPWEACRNGGGLAEFQRLLGIFEASPSLRSAVQYCGANIGVESRQQNGTVIATTAALGAGAAPTAPRTSAPLRIASNGVLSLSGALPALQCPAGVNGDETLEVRFEGVLIETRSTAPYLAAPLLLSVATLRSAAGLADDDEAPRTLTLHRSGSGCSGTWGAAPNPLISIELRLPGPTQSFQMVQAWQGNGRAPNGCFGLSGAYLGKRFELTLPRDTFALMGRMLHSSTSGEFAEISPLASDMESRGTVRMGSPAPTMTWTPTTPGGSDGRFEARIYVESTDSPWLYRADLVVDVVGDTARLEMLWFSRNPNDIAHPPSLDYAWRCDYRPPALYFGTAVRQP